MKRDELFEVLEPPPHGLTRLRARLEERRSRRLAGPLLVLASAAAVLTVALWPRPEAPRVDFSAALITAPEGVTARGETAVEAQPSSNPNVVIYRAEVLFKE